MPIELPIKTTTQLWTSLIPGILNCAKWTGCHLMLIRTLISAICAVSEQNSEVRRCPTSAVCQGKAGSIWGCSQSGCVCWRGSCTEEKPLVLQSCWNFTLRVSYYPQKPGVQRRGTGKFWTFSLYKDSLQQDRAERAPCWEMRALQTCWVLTMGRFSDRQENLASYPLAVAHINIAMISFCCLVHISSRCFFPSL